MRTATMFLVIAATLLACVPAKGDSTQSRLREQVASTERAFARTMADRDHEAFSSFLSPEAVFFFGETPLRGSEAVAEAWRPYFAEDNPPFSWEPETVEVLATGTLALSSGPVRDPTGRLIGTFTSVWQLTASGTWKIVFDKGNKACGE